MTLFLIVAALLLLGVLGVLLWPLLRRADKPEAPAESPALKILREQRRELEAERRVGNVDEASYAQSLAELERRALEESAAPERVAAGGSRRGWALALGLIVPLAAGGLYLKLGNPDALDPVKVAGDDRHVTPMQIDAMVANLAARVKANPEDFEGAQMLGRSYMVLERFQEAADVFGQLAEKRPRDAQVLADWADALASVNDNRLQGEPEKLIARALAADPNNVKARALAGTVAFEKEDYKGALAHWEAIAALVEPASEFGRSVQAMINEARGRSGMPPLPETTAAANASALKVAGRIELDASLQSAMAPDDTLFLFARSPAGGPPLAGMRFTARQLPLDFSFEGAPQMMAGGALPEQVIIGARISRSGKPTASPGDLQGFSAPVSPAASGVRIVIDETVH